MGATSTTIVSVVGEGLDPQVGEMDLAGSSSLSNHMELELLDDADHESLPHSRAGRSSNESSEERKAERKAERRARDSKEKSKEQIAEERKLERRARDSKEKGVEAEVEGLQPLNAQDRV